MIKIVIAEGHSLVREGFKCLLSKLPQFKVVGDTGDGEHAVEIARELKPDVLLLELDLPRLHGIDVIRRLRSNDKGTQAIVVSAHTAMPEVSEALRAGAAGYVLKTDSPGELEQAIKLAVNGEHFITPQLRQATLLSAISPHRRSDDPYLDLTEREREVLQLAADGRTNCEVAAELKISSRTVESHRANLMKKLNLQNQTDLVRYAVRRKIVTP